MAGKTQQALADEVGMTKASISGLELGTSKKPAADNLLPIAKAVHATPEWLLTGRGKESVSEPETLVYDQHTLTDDELNLLNKYRQLTPEKQKTARIVVDALAQ